MRNRIEWLIETNGHCFFGITETLVAVAVSAGIGETAAAIAVPALLGAAGGAAFSGITGGDPLKGALTGGITGGFGAAGGLIGDAVGVGATAGEVVGAAAGGALGAGATGGNPLTAALEGGAGAAISSLARPGGGLPAGTEAPGLNSSAGAGAISTPSGAQALGTADIGAALGGGPETLGGKSFDLGSVAPGGTGAPAGLDSVAAGNFAAENTANPAASALTKQTVSGFGDKGGAGGIGGFLKSDTGRLLAAGAPTALTLLRGQSPVPQSIDPLTAGGSVTGPAIQAENTNLAEANSGILQPGQAAAVAQYRQQAETQLRQQLASAGATNPSADSRFIAGMAQIEQNAQVQSQQFITSALTNGLTAAGDARAGLTTAAQAEIQQDSDFQAALSSAFQAAGTVFALGGSK